MNGFLNDLYSEFFEGNKKDINKKLLAGAQKLAKAESALFVNVQSAIHGIFEYHNLEGVYQSDTEKTELLSLMKHSYELDEKIAISNGKGLEFFDNAVAINIYHKGQIHSIVAIANYATENTAALEEYLLKASRVIDVQMSQKKQEVNSGFYSSIMDNVGGIVYSLNITDYDHNHMSFRDGYLEKIGLNYLGGDIEKISGYTVSEFLCGLVRWSRMIHEDDRSLINDSFAKLIKEQSKNFRITYRIHNKEGDTIWVSDSCCLSHTPEGTFLDGMIYDIGTEKQTEDKLKHLIQDLENEKKRTEEAVLTKNRFLAMLSHEIRNPLSGILGSSSLLIEDKSLSKSSEHLADVIQNSSKNLLDVLNDMLNWSREENDSLGLRKDEINLPELLTSIHELLSPNAIEKKISLNLDLDFHRENYIGDASKLRQIIMNLCNNALKFTERGGSIQLSAEEVIEDDGINVISIAVQDNGRGISSEMQEQLFEYFSQGDINIHEKFGGTGLGLAISLDLIHLMGGDIALESELGKGSTFTIMLPLCVNENATEINTSSNKEKAPIIKVPNTPLKTKSALIVEDNEMNSRVMKAMLENMGVEAFQAFDGHEAVDMAARSHFDLIIMDVLMPIMDGMSAAMNIREYGRNRNTPILALTANSSSVDEKQCLEHMDAFLVKPVSVAILKKAILNIEQK